MKEMSREGEHLEKFPQDFTDMKEKGQKKLAICTAGHQEIMFVNV